jgi:hypothetical protein
MASPHTQIFSKIHKCLPRPLSWFLIPYCEVSWKSIWKYMKKIIFEFWANIRLNWKLSMSRLNYKNNTIGLINVCIVSEVSYCWYFILWMVIYILSVDFSKGSLVLFILSVGFYIFYLWMLFVFYLWNDFRFYLWIL